MIGRRIALLAIALFSLFGCAASAHFYSKTGRSFEAVTKRAVRCEENEVAAVTAAGGEPIGTISAAALSVQATDEDVAEKAYKTAAKNGGTHVLLTEKGIDYFTVTTPGQKEKNCTDNGETVDCKTTYTEPTTSVYEKPTAKFVVFRVPAENWAKLPPQLRPGAI